MSDTPFPTQPGSRPATERTPFLLPHAVPLPPAAASLPPMSDNAFYRFLGGHPIKVLLRLLLISLVVGALLLWLDIQPARIIAEAQRFAQNLYNRGFDAVREAGAYIYAGAIVVVPIWFVLRLLGSRSPR